MKLKPVPRYSSNPTKALTEVKSFQNERRGFMTATDSLRMMINE